MWAPLSARRAAIQKSGGQEQAATAGQRGESAGDV